MEADPRTATVESSLPGRVRLRVPRQHRRDGGLAIFSSVFEPLPGIESVTINGHTGSVLIRYDPGVTDTDGLLAAVRSSGIVLNDAAAVDLLQGRQWPQTSSSAQKVIAGFRGLDLGVSRLTGGVIDAKLGIPLLLLIISLGRALRDSETSPAPWYSLLWYAYSMFMHWHSPRNGRTAL